MIFLMIFSLKNSIFSMKISIFSMKILNILYQKSEMIFFMGFFMIHKISYYTVKVFKGTVELAGWGGRFLMVHRNNAGRLGAGFISVCLETRWLGQNRGFYFPEPPCNQVVARSHYSAMRRSQHVHCRLRFRSLLLKRAAFTCPPKPVN